MQSVGRLFPRGIVPGPRKCQRKFRSQHPDCAAAGHAVVDPALPVVEELVGLEAEDDGTASTRT